MYGEAVAEKLKDFCRTRLRYEDQLAPLMQEYPELITHSDNQTVVKTDLAFVLFK
jgi:hypothetical protein